jgi:hypothetical protein
MMIVIGPTQTQLLLARILSLGCVIAALPIIPLCGKEPIGGPIDSNFTLRFLDQSPRMRETAVGLVEFSLSMVETLKMPLGRGNLLSGDVRRSESSKAVTLDNPKTNLFCRRNERNAELSAGRALRDGSVGQTVGLQEEIDVFHLNRNARIEVAVPLALGRNERRKHAFLMPPDGRVRVRAGPVSHSNCFGGKHIAAWNYQMVYPIDQSRAGLQQQPFAEL